MYNIRQDLILNYIVISRNEKIEKKCTLYPLRTRSDFSFRTKKEHGEFPSNSILLFPNGELLTKEVITEIQMQVLEGQHKDENVLNIVLIDSRWKKAEGILKTLPRLRKVSLKGYATGAIRRDPPPPGGLASCEALFLTSLLFGNPDSTLLDNYHYRECFFKLNKIEFKNE
jgi:hypothetical protein